MKLQMHSIHFDVDVKLKDFAQKKIDKLEKLYDRVIDGEVFFRLENVDTRDNKIIEVKLNIPGSQLFAKEKSNTFEAATDEAVEALRRQLKKFKEKQIEH
ncbi:MAG: ribosome-associated translation inhibitor RaiA [Bacteroidetes bacterium]|nr:ribosome-associated translation inhibitor RaiA [Bacteroidota bacterium]MDA1119347.1 ribosome-associated translation inhibitor RaiA [Bacteroidota bacterium]